MFGFSKPKLPIDESQRLWVDASFLRLAELLGSQRMLQAKVILPTAEHFPDEYDRSEASLHAIFRRVAQTMQVDPESIDLQMFVDTADTTNSLLPFSSSNNSTAGGLYVHTPNLKTEIAVNRSQMKDPMSLVATLAHELGHVILLRPGLVDSSLPDMEPLNDLLTVFLGFGIFNANSSFQFSQYTNNETQGWSTRRLGYLSEELFGYALARFAFERGEEKPQWVEYLTTNIFAYYKSSAAWLKVNGESLKLTAR